MGVNEEAIPIVLDLLDQVHGLRQMLRDLAAAVLRSRKTPGSGSLPRSAPPHPCGDALREQILDVTKAQCEWGMVHLWRAVDAEGAVLDVLVQSKRNKHAALKLMRKLLKKYTFAPERLVTDDLRSYAAAARDLGIEHLHERGR
jgi:hypothetical protein